MINTAHFQHWKNNIADMPKKDDLGFWVDLEDGMRYDPNAKYLSRSNEESSYEKKSRAISLEKAKTARKLAKFYGGSALTGTAKQKSWGESIREKIVKESPLSDEDKGKLVTIGGFTQSASFWIENRDVDVKFFKAEDIVSAYYKLVELENAFIENRDPRSSVINDMLQGIVSYMKGIPFNFKSGVERVNSLLH